MTIQNKFNRHECERKNLSGKRRNDCRVTKNNNNERSKR